MYYVYRREHPWQLRMFFLNQRNKFVLSCLVISSHRELKASYWHLNEKNRVFCKNVNINYVKNLTGIANI